MDAGNIKKGPYEEDRWTFPDANGKVIIRDVPLDAGVQKKTPTNGRGKF